MDTDNVTARGRIPGYALCKYMGRVYVFSSKQ